MCCKLRRQLGVSTESVQTPSPAAATADLEQQAVEQYFRGTGKIILNSNMWLGLYKAGEHLVPDDALTLPADAVV